MRVNSKGEGEGETESEDKEQGEVVWCTHVVFAPG